MAGENVTIYSLPTTDTALVANDRFVVWQVSASGTYQVTASQASEGVFAVPVTMTNQTTATAATAGAATLPSGPAGFLSVSLNGTAVLLPYYSV